MTSVLVAGVSMTDVLVTDVLLTGTVACGTRSALLFWWLGMVSPTTTLSMALPAMVSVEKRILRSRGL